MSEDLNAAGTPSTPASPINANRTLLTCALGALIVSGMLVFAPWSALGNAFGTVLPFVGSGFVFLLSVLTAWPKVIGFASLAAFLTAICFGVKTDDVKTKWDQHIGVLGLSAFVVGAIVLASTLSLDAMRFYRGTTSDVLMSLSPQDINALEQETRNSRSWSENTEDVLLERANGLSNREKKWLAQSSRRWVRVETLSASSVWSVCRNMQQAFQAASNQTQVKFPMTINGEPAGEATCRWTRFNRIDIGLPFRR